MNFDGTDANDTLEGTSGNDSIDGGLGDDLLIGGSGNDYIIGGLGDDALIGGDIAGVPPYGQLSAGGRDFLIGGAGADLYFVDLDLSGGSVIQDRGDSAVVILGKTTNPVAVLSLGIAPDDEVLDIINDPNTWGDSFIELSLPQQGIVGLQKSGTDLIVDIDRNGIAIAGNDLTIADYFDEQGNLGDNNLVFLNNITNPQSVVNLFAEESLIDDRETDSDREPIFNEFSGTGENDTLNGTEDRDILTGEAGDDRLLGSDGNDKLYGDLGDDILAGDGGEDKLYGDLGQDKLYGGLGYDTLRGEDGNDTIYGGLGNDYLIGGDDSDLLYGQEGNDWIYGNQGNDILIGGSGSDTLSGALGDDYFTYNALTTDVDIIEDFGNGADKVRLDRKAFTAIDSQIGDGFSEANEFTVVSEDSLVASSEALIVFSSGTGNLFYNQNGSDSGLGTGSHFANLIDVDNLSASDFIIRA